MARTYMHTHVPGYMRQVSQVSRSVKCREVEEGARGWVMQPIAPEQTIRYSSNMRAVAQQDPEMMMCELSLGSPGGKATKLPRRMALTRQANCQPARRACRGEVPASKGQRLEKKPEQGAGDDYILWWN